MMAVLPAMLEIYIVASETENGIREATQPQSTAA